MGSWSPTVAQRPHNPPSSRVLGFWTPCSRKPQGKENSVNAMHKKSSKAVKTLTQQTVFTEPSVSSELDMTGRVFFSFLVSLVFFGTL